MKMKWRVDLGDIWRNQVNLRQKEVKSWKCDFWQGKVSFTNALEETKWTCELYLPIWMSSFRGRSLLNLNSNHALRSLKKSWINSTLRGRNKNLLPKMLKAINRKLRAWTTSRWLKKKKRKSVNLKLLVPTLYHKLMHSPGTIYIFLNLLAQCLVWNTWVHPEY